MNYRTVTIHAEENLGTSGTKVIPIRLKDPITALFFQVRLTLASVLRSDQDIAAISKIEIVDGSDVLMELSAEEMAAVSFYEGNHQVDCPSTNLFAYTEEYWIRVNFGRFLRDPLLAFDPTKFLNPQLRVTYNAATAMTGATPVYLRVVAECFDEKVISPIGFLRMTQYQSHVGGASTYEYIDLPVDLDIRKLYLQTRKWGLGHFQLLTAVKLSEDNDKRIPFDLLCKDWMDMQLAEFGRCFQYVTAQGKGESFPFYHAICNVENGVFNNNTSLTNPIRMINVTGGRGVVQSTTTTDYGMGFVGGSLPYFVHCYPFGDQMDIDDWYKLAGKVDSLRFRVQHGTLGAQCTYNTFLQQLRRY